MLLCYGVWFLLFIGTTVHYKLPEHDSTNLRGDKCKNGQSYCEYINDCLPPNVVCEKCNLNEIECESVNNPTRCVTPKHFNRRESEWQWCGDGRCVHVETSCGTSPCKHNEFLCGGECKSQEYQDQFRTCEGKCVKRDEHCLKEPVIIVGSLGWAALIMLAIVLVMLAFAIAIAIVLVMLAIFGVYYIYKWCTDSAGEMDRDMSPADTLDASMNDVHSFTITMPSTATECTTQRNSPTNSTPSTPRALKSTDRTDLRNALAPSHFSTKPRTRKSTDVKQDITERSDPRNASLKLVPSHYSTTPRTTKSTAVKQKISGGAVPLNTVLQPALKKRRSVTRLQEKDIVNNKTSKYLLTTQNQDEEGGLETRLYKTIATRNYDFVLREDIEHAGSFSCPSNCGDKKGTLGFADSTYSQVKLYSDGTLSGKLGDTTHLIENKRFCVAYGDPPNYDYGEADTGMRVTYMVCSQPMCPPTEHGLPDAAKDKTASLASVGWVNPLVIAAAGDVLPTAGGGRQVVFNDVEVLTQTSPTAEESPKKRSYEVFEGIGARIAHLQERGVEGESTTPGYAERITKRSKRL